jgi:hypothetical protein
MTHFKVNMLLMKNLATFLAPDQIITLIVIGGVWAQFVLTAFLLMHDGHLHIFLQS